MLNSAWLTFTVAVLLASLIARQPGLLIVGLALLLAEGVSLLWGRYALRGVVYERALSEPRAFFGDEVVLDVRTENRKPLPLAWLSIEDEFPSALRLRRGRLAPSHKPRRAMLNGLLTLRWYERVTRRYPVECAARGEHIFGPAKLRTGDIFGFDRPRPRDVSDAAVAATAEKLGSYGLQDQPQAAEPSSARQPARISRPEAAPVRPVRTTRRRAILAGAGPVSKL